MNKCKPFVNFTALFLYEIKISRCLSTVSVQKLVQSSHATGSDTGDILAVTWHAVQDPFKRRMQGYEALADFAHR